MRIAGGTFIVSGGAVVCLLLTSVVVSEKSRRLLGLLRKWVCVRACVLRGWLSQPWARGLRYDLHPRVVPLQVEAPLSLFVYQCLLKSVCCVAVKKSE